MPAPGALYSTLMDLIVRFARAGLIHGDFNEFNILIRRDSGEPVVIDFPQMVSMEHPDAEAYFDRDVACVKRFFERRFHFVSTEPGPTYRDARRVLEQGGARRLDAAADASGFTKKMLKDLEAAIHARREARGGDGSVDTADDAAAAAVGT